MKNLYYLLFSVLLVVVSCKDNFETNAEYRESAVIYGLLDINSIKQYVKVTKGYQNPDGTNAVTLASDDPKVIQFQDSITVQVEEYNGNLKTNSATLVKEFVEGKDQGTFNSAGNYWFTFDTSQMILNPLRTYKIVVTNTISKKKFEAKTSLVSDFCVTKPTVYPICTSVGVPTINFVSKGKPETQDIKFRTAPNADIYKVYCIWNYLLIKNNDVPNAENKQFKFTIERGLEFPYNSTNPNNEVAVQFFAESFIEAFVNTIDTTDKENIYKRESQTLDFYFVAATKDMAEYMKAQEAYSSVTQTKPFYTNIYNPDDASETGAGIFASRFTKVKKTVINDFSIDYFRNNYPALGF